MTVRTYIASGNVVFRSRLSPLEARTSLEAKLEEYAGKPVGVIIRTAEELADVLAASPFATAAPNRTMVLFLNEAPPPDAVERATGRSSEEIVLARREIYIHYQDGMSNSKLQLPAARTGTTRNMNTVAKLVKMSTDE